MPRIASYNVHHCRGLDRRVDVARVARVIDSLNADFVALQELDRFRTRSGRIDQASELARTLGYHHRFAPAWGDHPEGYGIGILSRAPILEELLFALPQTAASREPRKALLIRAETSAGPVALVNTHLSLYRQERELQARFLGRRIAEFRRQRPGIALALCGDFNDSPRSNALRLLHRVVRGTHRRPEWPPVRRSFPSFFPLRQLDYVLASEPLVIVEDAVAQRSAGWAASDHLPVVARFANTR